MTTAIFCMDVEWRCYCINRADEIGCLLSITEDQVRSDHTQPVPIGHIRFITG